jgi:hypothetical protein
LKGTNTSLATPPVSDERAIREAERVMGPELQIIRVPNIEIPGASLLMVTRGNLGKNHPVGG